MRLITILHLIVMNAIAYLTYNTMMGSSYLDIINAVRIENAAKQNNFNAKLGELQSYADELQQRHGIDVDSYYSYKLHHPPTEPQGKVERTLMGAAKAIGIGALVLGAMALLGGTGGALAPLLTMAKSVVGSATSIAFSVGAVALAGGAIGLTDDPTPRNNLQNIQGYENYLKNVTQELAQGRGISQSHSAAHEAQHNPDHPYHNRKSDTHFRDTVADKSLHISSSQQR